MAVWKGSNQEAADERMGVDGERKGEESWSRKEDGEGRERRVGQKLSPGLCVGQSARALGHS